MGIDSPPSFCGRLAFLSTILASILCLAGCETTDSGVVKARGVYTTMAMKGQNLDLPGSGYSSCRVFGPGQTPAAIVTGYGSWDGTFNQPQPFELEVVEAASGRSVFQHSGSAFAGRVAIFNVPIRKSGDYKLKLLINNSVYDTWDFTVNREAAGGSSAAAEGPSAYAKGIFSVSIANSAGGDAFNQYDESFIYAMLLAVRKLAEQSNQDIFAQVPPGQLVVRLELKEAGSINSPNITGNTLSEALGEFFLRALQKGAPYRAWPAEVRAAHGSGTRAVEVTFHYD